MARDPLAVWTHTEAGEEIADGHPSVTNAQRAAAGRETPAERSAALLPVNRKRAAEQYAAGGLPGRHEERVGGHDHLWWEQRLPVALGWLLSGSG